MTASTPGTGKAYITKAERRSLRPDTFAETAARYGEVLSPELGKFERRLGIGDSGRGILVARMQLAALAAQHRLFTHVLLRDCTNLTAEPEKPEPIWHGAWRILSQKQKGVLPVTWEGRRAIAAFQATHDKPGKQSLLHGPAEMWALGALMCSTRSREAVEALAGRADVPLRYVDFVRGLSGGGSTGRSYRFLDALEAERMSAIDALPAGQKAAGHYFSIDPGRHADLTNPDLLVIHAEETLALRATP